MKNRTKPRIFGGICEHCGVDYRTCIHFKEEDAPIRSISKKLFPANYINSKIADIIIPHHDRHDHLKILLEGIDNSLFNIIIVSGGSFGENCNRGASIARTHNLIFINDDVEITNEQIIKMVNMLEHYHMVGATQIIGGVKKYWGIEFGRDKDDINPQIGLREGGIFPSGFCFAIQDIVWNSIGGFDERFRTGYEDVDFGLNILKNKYTSIILDLEIKHKESQSAGRFRYERQNLELLKEKWGKWLYENENIIGL